MYAYEDLNFNSLMFSSHCGFQMKLFITCPTHGYLSGIIPEPLVEHLEVFGSLKHFSEFYCLPTSQVK